MTLKTVIAAPYKSTNSTQLRRNELTLYYTFDRKWMNREHVVLIIKLALKKGLLEENGEYFKPTFDLSTVEIPLGYKPPASVFESDDSLDSLIEEIAAKKNAEITDVVAEVNSLIANGFDGNLAFDAAVVIIAVKYGIDVSDKIEDIKKNYLSGRQGKEEKTDFL